MNKMGEKTEYQLQEPDPSLLDTFPRPDKVTTVTLVQNEFTSICPITGQPDYGQIEITYSPKDLCLESKSLKLYLMSYRNYGAFCETLASLILKDLQEHLEPFFISVSVTFVSRGGITLKAKAYGGLI